MVAAFGIFVLLIVVVCLVCALGIIAGYPMALVVSRIIGVDFLVIFKMMTDSPILFGIIGTIVVLLTIKSGVLGKFGIITFALEFIFMIIVQDVEINIILTYIIGLLIIPLSMLIATFWSSRKDYNLALWVQIVLGALPGAIFTFVGIFAGIIGPAEASYASDHLKELYYSGSLHTTYIVISIILTIVVLVTQCIVAKKFS